MPDGQNRGELAQMTHQVLERVAMEHQFFAHGAEQQHDRQQRNAGPRAWRRRNRVEASHARQQRDDHDQRPRLPLRRQCR